MQKELPLKVSLLEMSFQACVIFVQLQRDTILLVVEQQYLFGCLYQQVTTCASSHGYQNYLFEGCMLMMRLDCVVCTSKLCLRFSTTIDYGITRLSKSGFVFYAQYGVKRHIQCFEGIYNVSSPYYKDFWKANPRSLRYLQVIMSTICIGNQVTRLNRFIQRTKVLRNTMESTLQPRPLQLFIL